jgi:hypothetical protein
LPPEVASLGQPLHVHPPTAIAAFLSKTPLGGTPLDLSPLAKATLNRLMFWAGTVGFPVLAAAFVLIYFFVPVTGGPPEIALGVAGVCLLAGVASLILLLRSRGQPVEQEAPRPPKKRAAASRPGYLFYRDALVVRQGEQTTVVRWDEVRELLYPAAAGTNFRLVTRDDREVDIDRWVRDYGDLVQAVVDRLNEVLVPATLEKIAGGKKAKFGPLAVTRTGLRYKGKKAHWDDVTSMVIQAGRGGRRLTVHTQGSWFAWCWVDLNRIPNNDVLYHVLCRTAPKRLLKEK